MARQVICNKDWCPVCGGYKGLAHRRRIAAWLPRLQQLEEVGYGVVTLPPEVRDSFRNDEALGALGTAIYRLLKRCGIKRGLRRWHWFGDVEGDEVPEYHPHLNMLMDSGYLSPKVLHRIKRGLARILAVPVERVNFNYQYSRDKAKFWHWLNYCLRPTFLVKSWDSDLAIGLIRFRNSSWWGEWKGEAMWEPEAVKKEDESIIDLARRRIHQGECPCCGEKLQWYGMVPNGTLGGKGLRNLGEGIFVGERGRVMQRLFDRR